MKVDLNSSTRVPVTRVPVAPPHFVSRTRPLERRLKRSLDILVAGPALFVLLPLLLMIAGAVWLSDGAHPIFGHRRLGRNGRLFQCLKFRSMTPDAERVLQEHLAADPEARAEWAETRKLKNDPRITSLGNFLRKTSLDELPQLFNVLVGDMSLVGPRPIVWDEVSHYGAKFECCFSTAPGITGLWQVSGRSDCTYAERVALDYKYATEWQMKLDLIIILRTIPAVLAQRGSR